MKEMKVGEAVVVGGIQRSIQYVKQEMFGLSYGEHSDGCVTAYQFEDHPRNYKYDEVQEAWVLDAFSELKIGDVVRLRPSSDPLTVIKIEFSGLSEATEGGMKELSKTTHITVASPVTTFCAPRECFRLLTNY